MAADIKNYLKEKEKRQKNQDDYKKKIRKHKLTIVYRVLLVAAALGAALALVVVQAKRHIYTGYDTVSSVNRETSSDAIDVRLKNGILTYSKDGAHCTDAKGNVKWNQTYVIQDVKLATCGSVAAIGSYNGREIYVQNTEKQLGTITTTMPIRNITVADTGRVTATLADTDATWIMTYEADGSNSYTGQAHMNDGGYPISISLSPSGELLAVSYLYVDAGVVKSNVVFYNFGPRIQELETQMEALQTENDTLNQELQGYVGADGTLQTIDSLLAAATTYLETQDITQTAANLETISASVNVDDTSEAFQKLYKTLLGLIGPQLSAQYYETGYNAYRSEDYKAAIENLSKAVIYDETNKDAWLSLGNSYRKSDDAQNAITTYDKIIELFPETETARSAQRYRSQLAENTAQ